MSMVNLVSGGLDSTLIGLLAKKQKIETYPLFIDYGQRAADIEWKTCLQVHRKYDLARPEKLVLSDFGRLIKTGLTTRSKDIRIDAFTPGRNLIFLLMASSYAFQVDADSVAIGLLSEAQSLFPDQREDFIKSAENTISICLGRKISILTPLFDFTKNDVIALADEFQINSTYSCHKGTRSPCGLCISCVEQNKII